MHKRKASDSRSVKMTFMFIYLLYMSAKALFNPYVTLFLQEKGYETAVIGMITAANSLVIIFSQPFWGILSDRMNSIKLPLIFCMVLQAGTALLLKNAAAVAAVMPLYCLFGFFSSPEGPLLDTWSLMSLKQAGDQGGVGRLKFLGCLGYSACSTMTALAVSRSNAAAMLPVYAAVLLATAGILAMVREKAPERKGGMDREAVGSLLRDRGFLMLLGYVFLMQIPHRMAYTFFATYITHLGGGRELVGFTSAVMFLSEGIMLYFSKRLFAHFRPQRVVLGSSMFFFLWQVLYAVIPSAPWVVGIAALDGPSYGLFCIGMLYTLDAMAPGSLRATYQTVAYAVYFGLAGIAGNALGGFLIDAVGYRTMYGLGAALTAASSVGYGLLMKRKEKENHACAGHCR